MAFFGSDSSDRELAQLKKVMNQKDLQLTSLQNEHHKKQEEIAELKKAKDTAVYNLQVEAERAYKAETALALRNNELAQAKLRLSNQESSLNAANERIKVEERENQKLQYQLDLLSAGSSQSSNKRVHDQEATLKAQIRQLEQELKKSESEKETIRHEAAASSAGGWGINEHSIQSRAGNDKAKVIEMENEITALRSENVRLMEEARNIAPPTSTSSTFSFDSEPPLSTHSRTASVSTTSSRTRRRASSVSTIPRLESQIEELRSQATNSVSPAELDSIKSQLAAAKKQANKMENEKMALERKAKNDVDDLRSKLDDAQDELNFFRRGEMGESSHKAKQEMDAMVVKVTMLQGELDKKALEVQELGEQLKSLQDLEMAFAAERSKVVDLESRLLSATASLSRESSEMAAKIVELEQQLASSTIATSTASKEPASSDRKIRQLQRDLAGLQEELSESDRLLAEKETEIFALRTCLPIPGSPTSILRPELDESAALHKQLEALEEQCQQHTSTIAQQEERARQLEAELKAAVIEATNDRNALHAVRLNLEQLTEELNLARSEKIALQTWLAALQTSIAVKEDEAVALATQLSELERKREEEVRDNDSRQEGLRTQANAAAAHVHELEEKLEQQNVALEEAHQLCQRLEHHSHSNEEFAVAVAAAEKEATARVDVEAALASVQVTLAELQASNEALNISKMQSESVIIQLESQLETVKLESEEREAVHAEVVAALQKKLTETEGNLVAAKLDLTETCAALDKGAEELTLLEAHRDDLLKQNGVYTSELATLQDAMADRSTISDARERDVALFRQEEEVKALQAQLATLSAERAEDGSVASFETAQLQIAKTELEARVLELSNEVSVLQKQLSALRVDSTPIDTDTEVDRLLIAIERLRKERDELRQSLNFANHDKDFALKASSADRISALNELDLVKERLQIAVDAQKTLTEELEVRSTRVTELETARAESVGGYAALASEKEQLAVELQQVRTALREAESLVSSLSASAEGLDTEMADAQRRCNEAEELAKQRLTELEEARATAGEDVRQLLAERVQASSKPADTAARQLKQDLDEQLQRVIRRDAQIASHQAELKRLKLNRDLMETSLEDLSQEITNITGELDEERAAHASDLAALKAAHGELLAQNESLSAVNRGIQLLEGQVASLQADLSMAHATVAQLEYEYTAVVRTFVVGAIQACAQNGSQARLLKATSTASRARATKIQEQKVEIASLRQNSEGLSSQVATLQESQRTMEAELCVLRGGVEDLDGQKAALSLVKQEAADLLSKVETSEALIQSLKTEKSGLESELEALVSELSELESSAHEGRSELLAQLEQSRKATNLAEEAAKAVYEERDSLASELARTVALKQAAEEAASNVIEQSDYVALQTQLSAAQQHAEGLQIQIEALSREQEAHMTQLSAAKEESQRLQVALDTSEVAAADAAADVDRLRQQLADAKAEAVQVYNENDVYRTGLSDAQSTAASSLEEQDRLLKALQAAVEEKVALQASTDEAVQRVSVLESQLSTAQQTARDQHDALVSDHEAVLASRVAELQLQLDEARAAASNTASVDATLHVTLETTRSELELVREELVRVQCQLDEAVAHHQALAEASVEAQRCLATSLVVEDRLRQELAVAQRESKQATGLLKFEESKAKNLAKSLEAAHANLTIAQREASEAVSQSRSTQISVSKLMSENHKLQAALDAPQPAVDLSEYAERISQLEATLDQKIKEVDEADDKVRDAYKANARLEKKVAKLERKLTVAVPAEAAVVPVELPPRMTPRTVNVFEPAVPPTVGSKRGRDEPEVERMPADAIMQPPAFTPGRPVLHTKRTTPARLTGFTPTRRVSGEAGLKGTPARTPASRVPFGTDITNGVRSKIETATAEGKPVSSLPRNAFSVLPS